MRLIFSGIFIIAFINNSIAQSLTSYVNPFIGTGGHGHTYPGAVLPHGMVQLSPDTRLDGWDGCGGYHYSDSFIYGFSHTHLSGTGVSDWGDILLMPMNGQPSPDNKKYGSVFQHANEKASPGYYNVKLDDDNIDVELTATERTGFHKYIFSKGADQSVILDLKHRDEVLESSIHIEDAYTVSGLRRSKAWAVNQYVYFVIKFSRPVLKSGIWINDSLSPGRINKADANNLKAYFQFDANSGKEILVKVAISAVSVEGAKRNLVENKGWNFNTIKNAATKKWERELSKIIVQDSSTDKKTIFYTALYHTAIVPNINMDVDGQYRGRDNKIHKAEGFTHYSVFSLWDTYRAAHPLYTIIDKERTLDYIKTFLVQYQQGGRLPVWELSSNETDCMIGYHSVPVIVDAYMKGIRNFDTSLALEAMIKSANWPHLGLPAYMEKNMLEIDDEHESVSKTLEYAYDDWCIALFAKALGKNDVYENFIKRAQAFKNMLDPVTAFMRPRKNGGWLTPFDAREVNNHFTEANSWQYSFYMPQDIEGYMKMTGGKAALENKLNQLFSENSETTGRQQSDITGLIGQYAHGNEPSHHIAYLYSFAGVPHKTQEMVNRVMNEMYQDAPDGLSGNEDCGQMSAWYIMSALGFYPVTPGTNEYIIGTPAFKKVVLNLENGKKFEILAHGRDKKKFYIKSAALNKKTFDQGYISHQAIMNGGQLAFNMQPVAGSWGQNKIPSTSIRDFEIVLNPVIHGAHRVFKTCDTVSISYAEGTNVFYTVDGTVPGKTSVKYSGPFIIDSNATIQAIAIDKNGNSSAVVTAKVARLPHSWTVHLNKPYEPQYSGGGPDGLVDGLRGEKDWRKGYWQGYQHTDAEIVIDLNELKTISKVSAGFLQDTRAWIVMPREIEISVSEEGKNFNIVFTGKDFLPIEDLQTQLKQVIANLKPVNARFVKLVARQYGKLPQWHEGAGGDTHIFIDEIEIY